MTVLANAKTYPWSEYTLPSGQRAYAIYGVPFFAPAGSGDRDDLEGHEFDGAWMREAVERFAKRKADNYWAPVHLGHQDQEHPTDNRPFAGFLDNMRMTHMEFDGESQDVLVGDLVDIPPAVFQEIQSGAWPYRSIEIRPPYDEVSSLALLSTIPPHHKFGVLALDSVGTATAMFQAPMRLMRQPAEVSAVQFSQARSCWAQQYATGGQTVAGGHMRLGVSDDDKGKAMPCDKTEKKPPFPFADEEPDEDEEDPEEDPEEDTISMEDDDGSDEEDDEQFSEDQARDEGGRFSGGGGDRAKPVKSRKGDEEARVRREQKKWQKQRDANRQNEMREIRSRRKDRKRSVSSMYADDGTPIQFGEPPDDDEYDDEEVIEPEDEMAPEGETVEGEAESFGGEETPEEEAAEVEQGGEVQTEGVPPEGAPPGAPAPSTPGADPEMKILITGLMARIDQIAQAVGANATSAQPAATDTSPPAEGQASTLPNTVNPVATLQQESAMADAKQFAQMRAEIDETRKEMARLRAENLEAKWSARVKQDVVQLAQEGRAIDTAATEAALLEYAREGGNAVYALRLKELREQYPEGERPHRAMTFAQQGSTPGVRIPKTLVRFHKELGPTSKAYQFAAERHDVEVGLGNTDPTKLEATIIKALRVRGLISEADGSMTLTAKGR